MPASTFVRGILGAATAGSLLFAGALAPAYASHYQQPTVVSTDAANWTPDLVVVSGQAKPVAYSIAEAGSQMVVGGRFSSVEDNSTPGTNIMARSNVFAFSATTGAISQGFAPQVNGDVWSVMSDGTSVYIGGAFTTVNGTPRTGVAKLSLATGAVDPNFNANLRGGRVSDMQMSHGQLIIAGTFTRRLMSVDPASGLATQYIPVSTSVTGKLPNSDSPQVFKFDVSPDGQHLVAVGNFTTVATRDRPRVFMLNLGSTNATLSDWSYAPLSLSCASTRRNAISYVQDVDFAPDSSYFALASFGYMYQTGQRGYQLCDSVSRFETANLSPTQPTWINYTGGDSLKSVAITGPAVYVQGHSRWLDNPYGQDSAGPGAVDRLGGGAVDSVTGKALAWNPVMPQQSGGFQILPTASGVWFVTDGARFGGEYHRGIRFAPLP